MRNLSCGLKKRIGKTRKRLIAITIVVTIILFFIFFYFKFAVNPVVYNTVNLKTNSLGTRAINNAITQVVNGVIYDDLITIVTDDFGNINLIQANTFKVNSLTEDLIIKTQDNLEKLGRIGIDIPIGTFTGIPIFVGQGFDVQIKINPIGAVNCAFSSKFETSGINQTIHRIYLNINANIGVVLPIKTQTVSVNQQFVVCESIIVGQVPEVYLYSDNLDSLLNFVPT